MTQTTRNYAKVLYDLKVPKEAVEQAKDIFGKSPELRETLVNPVVPVKSKKNIIDKIFRQDGDFPQIFVNFLKQVCENHRMNDIMDILDSYTVFIMKTMVLSLQSFTM